MEHLHVLVNGHRVHFIATGQGEPLILLHGLGAWSDLWASTMAELEKHFLVVAPDILGFGRSEAPRMRYTRDVLVRWLGAFMDVIGCHNAHLCGNSMGGAIALDFAWRFPERVKRLILVDPAGLGPEIGFSPRLGSLPLIGELLAQPWHWNMRRAWRHLMGDPAWVTEEFVDYVSTFRSEYVSTRPYLGVLREYVRFGGLKETLEHLLDGVKMPALLVWGEKDHLFPVIQGERAAKRIPQCTYHVMRGCGHVPFMERPAEFADLVLSFLGRSEVTRIERRAHPEVPSPSYSEAAPTPRPGDVTPAAPPSEAATPPAPPPSGT